MLFLKILFISLFIPTVTSDTTATAYNNHMQLYENDSVISIFSHIIPTTKYQLQTFVSSLYKTTSYPILLAPLLTKYNQVIQEKKTNILTSFFTSSLNAEQTIRQFVDETNKQLYELTSRFEAQCLQIFAKAGSQNVFDGFSIHDFYDSPKSADSPDSPIAKENKFRKKMEAVILATTASFFSGDYITPLSLATDAVFLDAAADAADKTRKINASRIGQSDSEIWSTYSKIYCINSFSASLHYDETTRHIRVIGDKIPYEFINNFLAITQYNIERKLSSGALAFAFNSKSKESADDGNKNKVNKRILENLMQQFEIIKMITDKIEELVMYELYENIQTISETQLPNGLDMLMKYICSKLYELVKLKELLGLDFPITQMQIKEQQQLNIATKHINEVIKTEIAVENAEKLAFTVFTAEQEIHKNKVLNDLQTLEFEAFTRLYIYGPLKRTGVMISNTVIALPAGIASGGIGGIYTFIKSILSIIVFNPVTSGVIIFIGIIVLYATALNTLLIGYNFCKLVFWFVTRPFTCVSE